MAAGARRGRVIAPFAFVFAFALACGVANAATMMRARVPTVRGDDARCDDARGGDEGGREGRAD